MERVGPKSEARLLEEGCLLGPPEAVVKVADPDPVCSRSLHDVTLHFRASKEQKGGCCG